MGDKAARVLAGWQVAEFCGDWRAAGERVGCGWRITAAGVTVRGPASGPAGGSRPLGRRGFLGAHCG